jgi:two-component system response regulator AtoC
MKARVIVATNKNLQELVEQGKFREDLFYRINVVSINVPPLRERKEDIPMLVVHFLQKINRDLHKNVRKVPYEVVDLLQRYEWIGNIRELENSLLQAVVLAKGEAIERENILLRTNHNSSKPPRDIFDLSLSAVEKSHIIYVLEKVNWDKKEAAKVLKISRQTLYNKIKDYSIIPLYDNPSK